MVSESRGFGPDCTRGFWISFEEPFGMTEPHRGCCGLCWDTLLRDTLGEIKGFGAGPQSRIIGPFRGFTGEEKLYFRGMYGQFREHQLGPDLRVRSRIPSYRSDQRSVSYGLDTVPEIFMAVSQPNNLVLEGVGLGFAGMGLKPVMVFPCSSRR